MRFSTVLFPLAAVVLLAACGQAPSSAADPATPPATQAPEQAPAPAANPPVPSTPEPASATAQPLQVGDVDAYARGMRSEIEWLQSARGKLQKARADKDDNAVLEALSHANSPDLDAAAAKAAGMDVARYGYVRNTIDGVLMSVAMQSAPNAPASLQIDPYKDLGGEVADALKVKMGELQELHAQALGLRMKIAEG